MSVIDMVLPSLTQALARVGELEEALASWAHEEALWDSVSRGDRVPVEERLAVSRRRLNATMRLLELAKSIPPRS